MNSKPIVLTIAIIAILGFVSITFSYGQTALADQGVDPNNSVQASPLNAQERFESKMHKALDNDGHEQHGDFSSVREFAR